MATRIVPDVVAVADRWGIAWHRDGDRWLNRYGRRLTERQLVLSGPLSDLAAMGADHLGQPLTPMPATHRTALDGVQWPTQEVAR